MPVERDVGILSVSKAAMVDDKTAAKADRRVVIRILSEGCVSDSGMKMLGGRSIKSRSALKMHQPADQLSGGKDSNLLRSLKFSRKLEDTC